MEGTTLRIENSSRAHAESLHRLLATTSPNSSSRTAPGRSRSRSASWPSLLLKLFDTLGVWLDSEQVDSLLLHFDQRQYTLLRPSKDRLHGSNAFLLERVAQLETALGSRIVIEQAKGILAHALDVSVDQAFDLLRKTARDRGQKLHELAAAIAASPMQAERILSANESRT